MAVYGANSGSVYGGSEPAGSGVSVAATMIYGKTTTKFLSDVAPANTVTFTPALGAN